MIWLIWFFHLIVLAKAKFVAYSEFFIFPYLRSIGMIPYSQIIDQHFPALFFFPLASESFLRIVWIVVIMWQSYWVYKLSQSKLFAVTSFMLWQIFLSGNKLWLETFLPVFILPAIFTTGLGYMFIAGILIGLAILFKQTVAILGLVIFFRTRSLSFAIGLAMPLLITVIWLFDLGSIQNFWHWTVVFNLSEYAYIASLMPSSRDWIKLFIIGVVILLGNKNLWWWIVPLMLSIGSRFDAVHLHSLVPFLALSHASIKYKRLKMIITAIVAILAVLAFTRQMPSEQVNDLSKIIKSITLPNDEIFLLGVQPHVYFLTKTRPLSNYLVYQLPWYMKSQQQIQLDILKNNTPEVVIIDQMARVDQLSIAVYAKSLVEYVYNNYYLWNKFSHYEIYKRNAQ